MKLAEQAVTFGRVTGADGSSLFAHVCAQRRQLLDYLKARDEQRYKSLIERLGIRR